MNKILFTTLLIAIISVQVNGYIIDYGPIIKATKGAIWPKPTIQSSKLNFNTLRPSAFSFETVGYSCDILQLATVRYQKIIEAQLKTIRSKITLEFDFKWRNTNYNGHLDALKINLKSPCEKMPYLGMDESYDLIVSENLGSLEADSVWGILRGLESFSQLLYISPDGRTLILNETKIYDTPRFPHRGLLVDTSRHFITIPILEQIIDGLAYNKFNVFHWHIVDDHSFPYQSRRYPEMTRGAFHPTMIYSQNDVASIIEYARLRGIRVMAEFDTPGHTASWGASHRELLTACGGPFEGKFGPINPIIDENYDFIYSLLEEVIEVFPDKYIHLGGDEVGFECWQSNQEIKDYMKLYNITSYVQLEEFYIQKIIDKVSTFKVNSIVWQEVYTNGVRLPKDTVVHVWTGDSKKLLSKITRDKFPALLSTCWYLDHLSTGGDWLKFYKCDPWDFNGTDEQKNRVMGGEACMWSEVVDDMNIIQRIFPRACATAEKLWSQTNVTNIDDAMERLEEHYCRLRLRNIRTQVPSGPGLCIY